MEEIRIACEGAAKLSIDVLADFQGSLKMLTDENYKKLRKEILELGFSEPVSVWQKGDKYYLLNGHQRVRALKQMRKEGYIVPDIPVNFVAADSEHQAKKKVLALTSQYGEITRDGLYEFMSQSNISFLDVESSFRFPEIKLDLFEQEFFKDSVAGLTDDDSVPEIPKEARTRAGDIYILGDHRLMCGDSTSIVEVQSLMCDEKANLLLTDPPYGVSYTEKNEWLNSLGKAMACPKAIKNDSMAPENMKYFWTNVFVNAFAVSSNKMSYYIFGPQGGELLLLLQQSILESGFQLKHVLVWVKNNHVLGRCDYHYKHEPIIYGWKKDGTHIFHGRGSKTTSVWDFNRQLKNDLHPTMKPIEVLEEAILNSSLKDESVLDLFGGSGSTLIACEKTKRKCFMMEIDPIYCDVIVKRWEDFSGKKAVLENQASNNTAPEHAQSNARATGFSGT